MTKVSEQEKLFEAYRESGGGTLADILDQERDFLFDYILRMTGQYSRAVETCDDVLAEIEHADRRWETLVELRVFIFSHSRSECMDVWNAETEKLENQALEGELDREDAPTDSVALLKQYLVLDRYVAKLSPHRREAILLNCRHGFSLEDAAEIMEIDLSVIATEVAAGLKYLELEESSPDTDPRSALRRLEPHHRPENETIYMTDLQQIMGDIDKGIPGRIAQFVKKVLVVAALGGGVYMYLYQFKLLKTVFLWLPNLVIDFFK